jgi:hypothetical protein
MELAWPVIFFVFCERGAHASFIRRINNVIDVLVILQITSFFEKENFIRAQINIFITLIRI